MRRLLPDPRALARPDLLVILMVPLGVAGAQALERPDRRAQTRHALLQVADGLDAYREDQGRYPRHLEELAGVADLRDDGSWGRPYLSLGDLEDPWGGRLVYSREGRHAFRLVSYGADGLPGGRGERVDLGLSSRGGLFSLQEVGAADRPWPDEPAPPAVLAVQPFVVLWLALAGGAATLVLRGRRRRRAATPDIRLRLARASLAGPGLVCAYCRDDAGSGALGCPGCGGLLHGDCWSLAGTCPTLGCHVPAALARRGPGGGRNSRYRISAAMMRREGAPAPPAPWEASLA